MENHTLKPQLADYVMVQPSSNRVLPPADVNFLPLTDNIYLSQKEYVN